MDDYKIKFTNKKFDSDCGKYKVNCNITVIIDMEDAIKIAKHFKLIDGNYGAPLAGISPENAKWDFKNETD